MIDISKNEESIPTFSFEELYDMKEAAKLVDKGIGRNHLLKFLREKGILMHNNEPYQSFIDRGYFKYVIKTIVGYRKVLFQTPVTLVTGKGIEFIKQALEDIDMENQNVD